MKHSNYFKGKVAIITGSGEGLGQALAVKLAECNAIVVCTDKDIKLAENTVSIIKSKSKNRLAYAFQLDVSDTKQIIDTIDRINLKFGVIDYLFNNAGVAVGGEIRDLNVSHWQKILDVNLLGLITCSTEVFRLMSKVRHGQIVNVASLSGLLEYTALNTPYAVSKHGVVTFSKALRLEALDFNIKVTLVCPGAINTLIGKTMEHINANDNAKLRTVKFIENGISSELAAQKILTGIMSNKKLIIFPAGFKSYYFATKIFRFLEKSMALKMIRDYRKNDRLE